MTRFTVAAATGNPGKLAELGGILALYGIDCVSAAENGTLGDPVENADGFLGNALIKARAAHSAYPVLSDDSGVCVRALGGAPGIHTARYAGENARPADNIAKLLREMAQLSDPKQRAAHFYCCCVLKLPDGREFSASGICRGSIAFSQSGTGGFGYDPVFLLPDGRCFAEIPEAEKNRVSHRARALKNLISKLKEEHIL